MSGSQFEPITFTENQDLDADTLNILSGNDEWLFNNMPTGFYSVNGINKNTGLKVAGGIVNVGPTKDKTIYKEVGFGNFFSASCRPVVTISHAGGGNTIYLSIGGIGSGNNIPDNRGFSFHLRANPTTATKNYFPNIVRVHFIALGW